MGNEENEENNGNDIEGLKTHNRVNTPFLGLILFITFIGNFLLYFNFKIDHSPLFLNIGHRLEDSLSYPWIDFFNCVQILEFIYLVYNVYNFNYFVNHILY